jgi:hypothetical protein
VERRQDCNQNLQGKAQGIDSSACLFISSVQSSNSPVGENLQIAMSALYPKRFLITAVVTLGIGVLLMVMEGDESF